MSHTISVISSQFSVSYIDGYIDAFNLVEAGPLHSHDLMSFMQISSKYMNCLHCPDTNEDIEYAAGFDCGAAHLYATGYQPLYKNEERDVCLR